MPKIQESKEGQFRVTIPFEIMKLKGWVKGQSLVFAVQMNGEVALKELKD